MEQTCFERIKKRLEEFTYTSLNYYNYEAVANYEVVIETNDMILMYHEDKEEHKSYGQFHWAANHAKDLITAIEASGRYGVIGFIPEVWVPLFYEVGFVDFAKWRDYWCKDLQEIQMDYPIVYASQEDLEVVSHITYCCEGQSRGFSGLAIEWLVGWLNSKVGGITKGQILLHKEENKVVGVAIVGTYWNKEHTQSTLWIRAIAVKPEWQKQGIGKKLVEQALMYGKSQDASRAYLAADECNEGAIRLYKKIGFIADEEECEINLINTNNKKISTMKKQYIQIESIPSVLWGEDSKKICIAIHGQASSKEDDVIAVVAEEAVGKGYQVISFDLPEHGERTDKIGAGIIQQVIKDLQIIMDYATARSSKVSLFACSMGAYFSLLSYSKAMLGQCLFLSPVVNMQAVIEKMMGWFEITEKMLEEEKEIYTPIGQSLYWDYYSYVKGHPIRSWCIPTSILYGEQDNLCDKEVVDTFCQVFEAEIQCEEGCEHYFHTPKQLNILRQWVREKMD